MLWVVPLDVFSWSHLDVNSVSNQSMVTDDHEIIYIYSYCERYLPRLIAHVGCLKTIRVVSFS